MYEKITDIFKAYKLEPDEIEKKKKRMGITFPNDLRNFYKEVGYGFGDV